MASINKASSGVETQEFLQQESSSITPEYSSFEAFKAEVELADMNDTTSSSLNIIRQLSDQGPSLPAAELKKAFPLIANEITTDGSYTEFKMKNDRRAEQQALQNIINNSPVSRMNSIQNTIGSFIGAANAIDIAVSAAAASTGVLAPFALQGGIVSTGLAGFLNFGVSNVVENTVSEAVTAYSDNLDLREVSYQDRLKNIGQGVIIGQGAYLAGKQVAKIYKDKYGLKAERNRAIKAMMDEKLGKKIDINEFDDYMEPPSKVGETDAPGGGFTDSPVQLEAPTRAVPGEAPKTALDVAEDYMKPEREFTYDEAALKDFMAQPDTMVKGEVDISASLKDFTSELHDFYSAGFIDLETYYKLKADTEFFDKYNSVTKGLSKCMGVV